MALFKFGFTKPRVRDYTESDMPDNRVQLFKAVLGVRWGSMVGLNLFYLLFWLPVIIWSGINFAFLYEALVNAEALNIAASVSDILATYLLILFPCIAITGPASAGFYYVLRNWARDEHSFTYSDFWQAAKGNWKQSLVISTISGAIPIVLFMLWRFYSSLEASVSPVFILAKAMLAFAAVVWLLMTETMFVMMVTYDLKLKPLFKNAFLFGVGQLPRAFGLRLLSLAVLILGFAVTLLYPGLETTAILITGFYYLVFGVSFSGLLFASFSNYVCEKYINPGIEGAETDIGLRPRT